jgi:hypothetical protein
VHARDEPGLVEVGQVATDGHRGHVELGRQLGDPDGAVAAHRGEDLGAS